MSRNSPLAVGNAGVEPAIAAFSLVQPQFGAGALLLLGIARSRAPLKLFGFDFGKGLFAYGINQCAYGCYLLADSGIGIGFFLA